MEPAAASGARSGARSQERPYVDALLHLAALSIAMGGAVAMIVGGLRLRRDRIAARPH